jgi:hypothetical protein
MTVKTMDDPIQWVLAHPERFFKTAKPNGLELAQSVWLDATLSGMRDVLIRHDGDVWVIAASGSWLQEGALTTSDLFARIVPLAAAGPNSMRSEILLSAFCTEVVAVVGTSTAFAKGTGTIRTEVHTLLQRSGLAAAIGFRL